MSIGRKLSCLVSRCAIVTRRLRGVLSVLGVACLSVAATLLVQHVLTPPRATAQSGPGQEIRASAFVIVGADGTVLGRLGAGQEGNGNLTLFDASGTPRVILAGAGLLEVHDPGGNLRFQSGYWLGANPGDPPRLNGILLDPHGAVGTISPGP